jgi:uncharacterized protein (DUF2141 family)
MRHYLLLLASALLLLGMNRPAAGSMELAINDIEHNYGTLWIGLYASEEAFLDKDQAHLEAIKVSDFKDKRIYLNDLDYGDYAVALFHDLNNNGECTRPIIPTLPAIFPTPSNTSTLNLHNDKRGKIRTQRDQGEIKVKDTRWQGIWKI